MRIREWQDLFAQLREMGRTANIRVSTGAILTGRGVRLRFIRACFRVCSRMWALKRSVRKPYGKAPRGPREYLGARGTKFAIFPGSGLFKQNPDWVLSAELVETSRLWARTNAAIEPHGLKKWARTC